MLAKTFNMPQKIIVKNNTKIVTTKPVGLKLPPAYIRVQAQRIAQTIPTFNRISATLKRTFSSL